MSISIIKIILVMVFGVVSLSAEMQNHYILGSNGLNSAVKPDGLVVSGVFNHYEADTIKNQKGDSINLLGGSKNYNFKCLQMVTSYFSTFEFFGAKYGFQVDIPLLNQAIDVAVLLNSFSAGGNGMRLSDIYVEPVNLRWQWDRFNLFVAYGIFAPSGKFRPFDLNNNGLGNWGNMGTVALTYFFDAAKTFSISCYNTYEIHCKKRGISFRPGDNYCVDFGIGKTFFKFLTVGLVGYYERQITYDKGKDVPNLFKNVKDRTMSLGGEITAFIPKINGQLTCRYHHEFAVLSRTEGHNFVGALSLIF